MKTTSDSKPGNCFILRYFAANYLLVLMLCFGFYRRMEAPDVQTMAFAIVVWVTYPAIYLLPAFVITKLFALVGRLLAPFTGEPARNLGFRAVCVLAVSATHLFLFADARVYENWGFHLNGFVWNLVRTPGGLDSLGASGATAVTLAAATLLLIGLQALLAYWLNSGRGLGVLAGFGMRVPLVVLMALSLSERVAYGVAHVNAYQPILAAAEVYPFYSRLTFNHLAARMGFELKRVPDETVPCVDSLGYPKVPMQVDPEPNNYNIVWLVSESLRADALDPTTMPEAWQFAASSARFTRHYSGGNGTRMGIFSMFYGICGAYWFPALNARRGPVIFEVLEHLDYQLSLHTSAKFTYPEFDKTTFVSVDANDMHQWSEGETWERDRTHVDHLLSFIEARDQARPFFTFSFFESPHARYSFPSESVIRESYLEDFNYATMSLEQDIELIRNRYLNSCHHLDQQLGRVFRCLEREGLLDSTIVVLTGDHGEEFMEKGRWGHGSTFSEEQVRVPLILYVPGKVPRVVDELTSHLDLPATILDLLGVLNSASDYSQGSNLLADGFHREHALLADWSRVCVLAEGLKLVLPMKGKGLFQSALTTMSDVPLERGSAEMSATTLKLVLDELGEFRSR